MFFPAMYPKSLPVIAVLVFLQACAAVNDTACHEQRPFTLERVREDVRASFPSVRQLSTSALASQLATRANIALFDVREPHEYTVSHLPGAVRVDPEADAESILVTKDITKKTVVFYCSVGVRSSKMAKQVQSELLRKGAIAVFNLEGGIFAWHNEERPLRDNYGATDFVHPFDRRYQGLLRRQSSTSFSRVSLKETQ